IERWGPRARAALVSARAASETGFLEGIVRGFGLEPPAHASKAQLRDRLQRGITESEGKGRIPGLVVGDATDPPAAVLGELQILSNASLLAHRPLEVILVGGPSLDTMLAGPPFESIRSRIGFQCRLDSLSLQATRRYLHELSTTTSEGGGFISRKAARE